MKPGPRASSIQTLDPLAGALLAAIASESGCIQDAAAKLVGVSQSTWSRSATGDRLLTEDELTHALKQLRVSRADFDRRLAAETYQSTLGVYRLRWLVAPRRTNGDIFGAKHLLGALGVVHDVLTLPFAGPVPIRSSSTENGSELARLVRSAWGLGADAPIADLTLIFGTRAVLLIHADVSEPGGGWLRVQRGDCEAVKHEVIVVPGGLPVEDQRWGASRMFAVLRRRSLDVPSESFLQDFAREFLLPKTAVRMLLRQFMKLPNPHSVASIATTILSQHFGAPFEEVAKMVAVELRLTKSPERVPIEFGAAGSNAWLTILRAVDLGANSSSSGSH